MFVMAPFEDNTTYMTTVYFNVSDRHTIRTDDHVLSRSPTNLRPKTCLETLFWLEQDRSNGIFLLTRGGTKFPLNDRCRGLPELWLWLLAAVLRLFSGFWKMERCVRHVSRIKRTMPLYRFTYLAILILLITRRINKLIISYISYYFIVRVTFRWRNTVIS